MEIVAFQSVSGRHMQVKVQGVPDDGGRGGLLGTEARARELVGQGQARVLDASGLCTSYLSDACRFSRPLSSLYHPLKP